VSCHACNVAKYEVRFLHNLLLAGRIEREEIHSDLDRKRTRFIGCETDGTLLTMLNYVFDSLPIALEMAEVVTPS